MKKADAWPAFNVERRAVSALKPYKGNARTHSEEQVAQIAASIREWGWTQPVLVDEKGGVIAGHGRLLAAQSLGIEEVPVIVARGWSKDQKRAYVLADNQLALNAGWDDDLLRVEIGALGDGFDRVLLGFGEEFLADLFADKTDGLTDPDDVPVVPVDPVSRAGDLWLCGSHRLLCGDSTSAEAVERLLAGVKPHLMVTDPPYGVNYDPLWREAVNRFGDGKAVARGAVQNDDVSDWSAAWALFPGDVAYVWHGALHAASVAQDLIGSGYEIRTQIIWAKQNFALSRGDYHWMHEPCWYAVRKGRKGGWTGDRKQTTLWPINSINPVGGGGRGIDEKVGHGTQKPVECMRRPIVNNSKPGDSVYEPFCGSGTTMIAAEMEGRRAYCMELAEAYCDVIVKRWQAFTGEAATLDGSGRTFEQVQHDRQEFQDAAE